MLGTVFSLMVVVVGGMFQTIQWSQIPMGASGSSTMRLKLFVSGGVPWMFRGGFMSWLSQVYFWGIGLLFWKAGLVMVNSFMMVCLFPKF